MGGWPSGCRRCRRRTSIFEREIALSNPQSPEDGVPGPSDPVRDNDAAAALRSAVVIEAADAARAARPYNPTVDATAAPATFDPMITPAVETTAPAAPATLDYTNTPAVETTVDATAPATLDYTNTLGIALELIDAGIPVFPVKLVGTKKIPVVKWRYGA